MKKLALFITLFALTNLTLQAAPSVPSKKELGTMVDKVMLAFNDAVQKEDFTGFMKTTHPLFQKEVSPEKFKTLFKDFIDQKGPIDKILKQTTDLEATFEPEPALDKDGDLTVKGEYATTPSVVKFELVYRQDEGTWKLISIDVKAK